MKILELNIIDENNNLKDRFKSILDVAGERSNQSEARSEKISAWSMEILFKKVRDIEERLRHGGGREQFQRGG